VIGAIWVLGKKPGVGSNGKGRREAAPAVKIDVRPVYEMV
jgi:hypothetical protein